jgi:hypothetical protein
MLSAFGESEMATDDLGGSPFSLARGRKRCRHCKARAVDPPVLTISPRNLHEWFLCDACWMLLEIGFSDARPYDDLYQYLTPIDGRLSDVEVYHHILRGRMLLERRGGLVRRSQDSAPRHTDPG